MVSIKGFRFAWTGSGFGNALIVAHLTRIVARNGINAVFEQHPKTDGLVDVPLFDPENPIHATYRRDTWKGVRNTSLIKNCDEPAILQYLNYVGRIVEKKLRLDPFTDRYIPVKWYNINVSKVNVAICSKTGPWAPYRNWPYFEELKKRFVENGISYIDFHEKGIMGIECLNYVLRCRLYLGLETGMSHYVSRFANGKALILQSGFCPFIHWAYAYDYDYLSAPVQCSLRPCFLTRRDIKAGLSKCDNDCMKELSVDMVYDAVLERLNQ